MCIFSTLDGYQSTDYDDDDDDDDDDDGDDGDDAGPLGIVKPTEA